MEKFKTIEMLGDRYEIGDAGTFVSNFGGKRTVLKQRLNHKGYCEVYTCKNGIRQKHYMHRLVYIAHKGPIPEGRQIDHLNGVKTDNRISNLEPVTNRENQIRHCRKRIGNGAKSEDIGVYWEEKRKRWNVRTTVVKGVVLHLGRYKTKEEAKKRYADVIADILLGKLSPELQARVDASIERKRNKAS